MAVSKPVYKDIKTQDLRKARQFVKPFTRHNDKLGFDFSVASNGYYVSYSKQVDASAYGGPKGFLNKAELFYQAAGMNDTANHFKEMQNQFTLKPEEIQQRQSFSVPDDL